MFKFSYVIVLMLLVLQKQAAFLADFQSSKLNSWSFPIEVDLFSILTQFELVIFIGLLDKSIPYLCRVMLEGMKLKCFEDICLEDLWRLVLVQIGQLLQLLSLKNMVMWILMVIIHTLLEYKVILIQKKLVLRFLTMECRWQLLLFYFWHSWDANLILYSPA